MAKKKQPDRRLRDAVKKAVNGNADDLDELLRHETDLFGLAYGKLAVAYDEIVPGEPLDSEQADDVLEAIEEALGLMRQMIVEVEGEN